MTNASNNNLSEETKTKKVSKDYISMDAKEAIDKAIEESIELEEEPIEPTDEDFSVDAYIDLGIIKPTELVLTCKICGLTTIFNMANPETEETYGSNISISDFLLRIRNLTSQKCDCPNCHSHGKNIWMIDGVTNTEQVAEMVQKIESQKSSALLKNATIDELIEELKQRYVICSR